MNVFILDKDMQKSAEYLDDAHLISQINEVCQILMANYNYGIFRNKKIRHLNHPVTIFYNEVKTEIELVSYLYELLWEYVYRFNKHHQNHFWFLGYVGGSESYMVDKFEHSKTLVNRALTDDIDEIRKYIMTKEHKRPLKWTRRDKPEWWA